ncbi:MAG: hypothetical protein Q4E70_00730 [Candidatus Saccharibacteria bacterium]|nr:hypothetical protein [Candidatus Saccharibacteria bacterium]
MESSQLNPFKNEDKKNKSLFILFIIIFIIFSLAITIIYFITRTPKHSGETDNIIEPNAFFINRTNLDRVLDTYPTTDILTDIEEIILDESEIASSPNKNSSSTDKYNRYTVTIENVSKLTTEPDSTYQATFNISDNRIYQATIREDLSWGSLYLCTIITRTDTKDSWLYINTNDSSYEDLCKNWGEEKHLTFKKIKTSSLSMIEK